MHAAAYTIGVLSLSGRLTIFVYLCNRPCGVNCKGGNLFGSHTPCPSCPSHSDQFIYELQIALHDAGVMDISMRYLDLDPKACRDLGDLYQNLGVPESMRRNFVVSIDRKFLFINYVPLEIITDFLTNHMEKYQKIAVFRDYVRELYMVMDEEGQIRECNIERSVAECFVKQDVSPPLGSIPTLIVVSGKVNHFIELKQGDLNEIKVNINQKFCRMLGT